MFPFGLERIEFGAFPMTRETLITGCDVFIPSTVVFIDKHAFAPKCKLHISSQQSKLNPHLKNIQIVNSSLENDLGKLMDSSSASIKQLNDYLIDER